jgi:diguanylate cyclase (GGDEF)-like protein
MISVAAGGVVFALLLAGFAVTIHRSQDEARQALTDRFASRAGLTAGFARNYVDDIARQEQRQAERLLSAAPGRASFEQVVTAFDFDAAVLLDSTGALLQVWPARPEILGKDMTVQYAHLRTAVQGRVGVSEMVPSAAKGVPVTAIAVPFDTPTGRRVLSGAFAPASSPLGTYLASINPIAGSNAFLVDRAGNVLAAARPYSVASSWLRRAQTGVQSVHGSSGSITVAVADVPGTPWRVALTAPSQALYAPVSHGSWAAWALLVALAIVGGIAMLLFVRVSRARLAAASTARTDALTGLPNRRAMEEHLAQRAAHAVRHGQDLVALMVDLDHFKHINTQWGHDGGDIALRRAADCLRGTLRAGDVAARWGGEEFLVLLPDTDQAGGIVLAERLRFAVSQGNGETPNIPMTASIGLAVFNDDPAELLRSADAALYEAKSAGRNRTAVAPGTDLHQPLITA